ncbi:MAG TPA: protein kinase [Thermoanaerobaculia bacterium]|nr:protein kinase [Thermoanaerobaculia bacterium]
MEISPGQQVGIFRFTARLGAGGMGEVWRGEDIRLGRPVAIKVLPPAQTRDEESRARLMREARTAAQLNHPGIATIHAVEEHDQSLFIVMELIEGRTLGSAIRQRALSEKQICRIGRQVAEALAAAHAKSIIHRDIKPDNILLTDHGVKVLDFGIAKRLEPDPQGSDFVTQTGIIMGTVHYMSPEQALGKTLDGRTDLYSLGVVLYQAVTDRLPFEGTTVTEILTQIIRDQPPALTGQMGISPPLAAAIDRALKKTPDERFANSAEMAEALDRAESEMGASGSLPLISPIAPTEKIAQNTFRSVAPVARPAERPPASRRLLGLAVLVLLIALGAGYALWSSRESEVATRTDETAVAEPSGEKEQRTPAPAAASITIEADPESPADAAPPAAEETATAAETIAAVEQPKAETVRPELAAVHYQRGLELLREGNRLLATAAFERSLQIDPAFAPANIRLGQILLSRRMLRPAAQQFEAALDHPERLDERATMFARVGLAIARGEREDARRLLTELLARHPDDPEVRALERELREERAARPRRRL